MSSVMKNNIPTIIITCVECDLSMDADDTVVDSSEVEPGINWNILYANELKKSLNETILNQNITKGNLLLDSIKQEITSADTNDLQTEESNVICNATVEYSAESLINAENTSGLSIRQMVNEATIMSNVQTKTLLDSSFLETTYNEIVVKDEILNSSNINVVSVDKPLVIKIEKAEENHPVKLTPIDGNPNDPIGNFNVGSTNDAISNLNMGSIKGPKNIAHHRPVKTGRPTIVNKPVVPESQQQKRQSISRIIVNPNLSDQEERSPLSNLTDNKRQQQQEVAEENKENTPPAAPPKFDLSFFSNSPSRPRSNRARNSILRLFDPLNESILDTPRNEPSAVHHLSLINEEQKEQQPIAVHADIINQLRECLAYEGELEGFVTVVLQIRASMEAAVEDRISLDQELNRLKLELNQLQQDRAALELELHQKDEVILKTQGEAQKKGNQYMHEIKQLEDKLNTTINKPDNSEEVKLLRDENNALKECNVQLNEKVKALTDTLEQYEATLSRIVPESEKLRAEHDTAKNHLSTLEMSFTDVHTKYERCKDIIVGFKSNEEALIESAEHMNRLSRKYEERYDTLKAHAKAQLDKANKDLAGSKEKHAHEINKFGALIKRLEIKFGSVQQALEQKTKECAALAALCDEISGSIPR